MAASAWAVYHQTKLKLGKKVIDFTTDSFKMALFLSTSNVGDSTLATPTYSSATNEVAAGFGYSTGGVALASVTWTNSAGTETLASGNASWTPSGTGIIARYGVIYDVTSGDLICWTTLDTTPADVSVNSVSLSANVFTLA